MLFKNKVIVIVCQQDWGEMFISKHHYAAELAKLGNEVYFLNGPDQKRLLKNGEIKIETTRFPNLSLITHHLFFPYILKFKARMVYNYLVKIHIRKIIAAVGRPVDIVWSFDLSDTIPLRYFPEKCVKIFMPVDEPQSPRAIQAAESADIILSVTKEIIEKYARYQTPKFSINHGVSEIFINRDIDADVNEPLHVGLSGNFLRPDIDREILMKIIESHPEIVFDCWGSVSNANSNLSGDEDSEALAFTARLGNSTNVRIHGPANPETLSGKLKEVDCFLICYDINKDQSRGTNYHKILEYLGSGKVIVSNNVTTYQNFPDLITMTRSRTNNDELPSLFDAVIRDIRELNGMSKQQARIDFAKQHLYRTQIIRIEELMGTVCPKISLTNP